MKPLLLTLAVLLCASTASAQEFYSYGTSPTIYTRSWSYSISTYGPYGGGYGYGYGYGFPRYQMPVYPQTYYPGYQGTIPGLYTNGYFIPGW